MTGLTNIKTERIEITGLTDINTERTDTTSPIHQDNNFVQISEIEIGDNLAVMYGEKWYVCLVERKKKQCVVG